MDSPDALPVAEARRCKTWVHWAGIFDGKVSWKLNYAQLILRSGVNDDDAAAAGGGDDDEITAMTTTSSSCSRPPTPNITNTIKYIHTNITHHHPSKKESSIDYHQSSFATSPRCQRRCHHQPHQWSSILWPPSRRYRGPSQRSSDPSDGGVAYWRDALLVFGISGFPFLFWAPWWSAILDYILECIETLPTTWELHVPKRFQSSAAEMMPKMKRKESVSAPKPQKIRLSTSPWSSNGGGSDRGRDGGVFSAAGAEFQLCCGRQKGGRSDRVTVWGWFVGCVLGVLGKLVRVYADADLEHGKKQHCRNTVPSKMCDTCHNM